MPVFFLVLLIVMTIQDKVYEVGRSTQTLNKETRARTLGSDLLVVRNALAAYRRDNPSESGAVSLADLGLPNWFTPSAQLHALIDSTHAYVYYTPHDDKPDLMAILGTAVPASTGVARNGQLQSPHSHSSIPLPAAIPNGSIVLML